MTDKQPIEQTMREIRKRLRLSMDGIVSTLMREQGIKYKINFGVNLPRIQEISKLFTPSADLADALWKEDVRELKILAILLHPVALFTPTKAALWTSEIKHQEIAELYCAKLINSCSFAPTLALQWIESKEEYTLTVGYLLLSRIYMQENSLSADQNNLFINKAVHALETVSNRVQRAALLALKRYGRGSQAQANQVLEAVAPFTQSSATEKQEIYNDLKFEFDYYS
jgi:3-methyladenine DNA glycosylase AlkD